MKQVSKSKNKNNERGSAGIKLLIVGILAGLIFHAGFQYIPVAYQGEDVKQDMKTAVINGVSMPKSQGKPVGIVNEKIKRIVKKEQLPPDTFVDVKAVGGMVSARVYYAIDVPILPFGIYKYKYVFDETVTPASF